jgi:hypothetical protein
LIGGPRSREGCIDHEKRSPGPFALPYWSPERQPQGCFDDQKGNTNVIVDETAVPLAGASWREFTPDQTRSRFIGERAGHPAIADNVAMNGSGVVLVFALSWVIPIALIVYLFRTLATMVEGLRSINAGVQRTAAAVEALAARGSSGA